MGIVHNNTEEDQFVYRHELRDWDVFWSPTHINRLIRQGTFPAPIQLNPLAGKHGSRKVWRASDLRAWRQQRLASRTASDAERFSGGEAA